MDLLVISHFDEDHISGLKDLLKHFSVGTLVLPYLQPWDRLVVTLLEDAAARSDLLAFTLAPASFILGLPGADVGQIVFVSASEGPAQEPGPLPGPETPEDGAETLGPLKFPRQDKADEQNEAGGQDYGLDDEKVVFLEDGGALTLPYLWEFVPYNDPANSHLADDDFRDAARPLAETLRQARFNDDTTAVKEALEKLKELYDDTFGAKPKQKNLISLFLYAGPIGDVANVGEQESGFRSRRTSWLISDTWWTGCDRIGEMLTGDGYLETKGRLQSFKQFYTPYGRLRRGACFQVMHHGSRYNWQAGMAAQLQPKFSIFSSNPNGEYYHPHIMVFRDFGPCRPRQVDDRSGWALDGAFIFLH